MVDDTLDKPLRLALRLHEIGDASPYRIAFAGNAKSGASFGFMQGDLAANQPVVTQTFRQALQEANFSPADIEGFTAKLSVHCVACPLSPPDRARVDAALLQGKNLVDAMDGDILRDVYKHLDACTKTAAQAGNQIAPRALIYMALWINMSGPPTTLLHWLGGNAVHLAQPVAAPPHPVDGPAMETYLKATDYFSSYAKNFAHMTQCAAAGAALLAGQP